MDTSTLLSNYPTTNRIYTGDGTSWTWLPPYVTTSTVGGHDDPKLLAIEALLELDLPARVTVEAIRKVLDR